MQGPDLPSEGNFFPPRFPEALSLSWAFVELGFEENTTTDLSHFVFFALGFSTSNNPSS